VPLPPEIREARETLICSFSEDPEFLHAYIANAAVVIMDYQSEREETALDFQDPVIRDEAAFRVMNWLFNPEQLKLPPYERAHQPSYLSSPSLSALERISSDSDMLE
jgi:hypothetical protein